MSWHYFFAGALASALPLAVWAWWAPRRNWRCILWLEGEDGLRRLGMPRVGPAAWNLCALHRRDRRGRTVYLLCLRVGGERHVRAIHDAAEAYAIYWTMAHALLGARRPGPAADRASQVIAQRLGVLEDLGTVPWSAAMTSPDYRRLEGLPGLAQCYLGL